MTRTKSLVGQLILNKHKSMCMCIKSESNCELMELLFDAAISSYEAQVQQQAYYIGCLLEEIRQLKEKL